MNCHEARARLLDYLDGELPPQERGAVQAHLNRCAACRTELGQVSAGADALRATVERLAPRRRYLSPARRGALMAARQERRRPIKLITMRRLVAAAAAAAIIAAAPFIISDYGRLVKPRGEALPTMAQAPAPERIRSVPAQPRRPVILAAMSHDAPMSVLHSVPPAPEPAGPAESTDQRVRWAVADTPGLRVPVENVLYDPDESSHWW